MIEFTILGQCPSGKNAQRIDPRTWRKYPSPKFQAWRADFQGQVLSQWGKISIIFPVEPVYMEVLYTPGDLIQRDATGILDALFHAMERKNGGCVVTNDSQFKNITWIERGLSRGKASLALRLEAMK